MGDTRPPPPGGPPGARGPAAAAAGAPTDPATPHSPPPAGEDPAAIAALPLLRPGQFDAQQAALHAKIAGGSRARSAAVVPVTDGEGRLAGPFNALLFAPFAGDAVQELGSRIRYGLSLSDREREIATLLAAGASRCAYELFAHRRLGAAAGLTAAEIDTAAAGDVPALTDPREQHVARFCAALLAGTPAPAEVSAATGALGQRAVVELVILVGYYQLLARLLGVAGVGAPGEEHT